MNKVRVADYIADFLYRQGINDVFMLTGGGAMFLNDGVAQHPQLKVVCNHHEQACAMGAVGYAKYKNSLGAVYVTTGCGGTNAITGLLDAWQDNVPCIFISGQVKKRETTYNCDIPLRQFGVQEADIVSIVKPLTKYAVMVNDPNEILYHLEKAVHLATSGRPGPVWLDIPLDVQGADIDESTIKKFSSDELEKHYKMEPTETELAQFSELLKTAERPIVIAGNGIRLGNSVPEFKKFVEQYNLPVSVSYLGVDLLPSDHPLFVGRLGTKGDRAGNFSVQNSDLVIVLGSRLSIALTGFEYDLFAREAKIVVVDIDPDEHKKKTVNIDLFINADVKTFLGSINTEMDRDVSDWVQKCREWKQKWPICQPEYENDEEGINMYYFMERLAKKLKDDSVVVSDAGSSYYVVSQALKIKAEQRYITSGAQADMGFTIPAAIGACIAKNHGDVIGITGDGSFQPNIQELQTIVHYNLPVKLFVWNNEGYLSNRTTQNKFFEGRFIGSDKSSGVSCPSFEKIAYAYGIKYFNVTKIRDLDKTIEEVINYPEAVICEVKCPFMQEIIPNVSAKKLPDGSMISKPIEDMYPFLDRDEFYSNMIVKPIEE